MYRVIFETAAERHVLAERAGCLGWLRRGRRAGRSRDPGTLHDVWFRFRRDGHDGPLVEVAGRSGDVTVDGTPATTHALEVADNGDLVRSHTPFVTGTTAVIDFDPPPDFDGCSEIQAIVVGQDDPSSKWYPLSVRVKDSESGRTYHGAIKRWLAGKTLDDRTVVVGLTPVDDDGTGSGWGDERDDGTHDETRPPVPNPADCDLTTSVDAVAGHDVTFTPLDSTAVVIGVDGGLRFTFNDEVDPKTFDPSRPGGLARSMSIRYVGVDGELDDEILATTDVADWREDDSGLSITAPGRFVWQEDRSLLIGPPEGGWASGRTVRFELDRSLSDRAGNTMRDDRDYVVTAVVAAKVGLRIDTPSDDIVYEPWIGNRSDDVSIFVSGTVSQDHGERVSRVVVSATNRRSDIGDLRVSYDIAAGDAPHDHLTDDGGNPCVPDCTGAGTAWEPDVERGGRWAIHLPLQEQEHSKNTAQAVVEQRYKWTIEVAAMADYGVLVTGGNTKVVYHEIFEPAVSQVMLVSNGRERLIDVVDGRPDPALIFNRSDVGRQTFVIDIRGDFRGDDSFRFDDGDEHSGLKHTISQSDDAVQGAEHAQLSVSFDVADDEDRKYDLELSAVTKAMSLVTVDLGGRIDTVPLELLLVAPMPLPNIEMPTH